MNNEAVQTQVSSTVQKLFGNEFAGLQSKTNDYARSGRFSEGRKYIDNFVKRFRQQ